MSIQSYPDFVDTFPYRTTGYDITGISQAASAVVTIGTHELIVGDVVWFTDVSGMTEINNSFGTVTAIGATTITVNINSSAYTAYSSSGYASGGINYFISESGHGWVGSGGHIPAIVDGELAWTGVSGNYAYVDVFHQPFYQYCDVAMNAGSTTLCVLMSSNDSSNSLENITHIRFTSTAVAIEVRAWSLGDSSPHAIADGISEITYSSPLVSGTTYRVGVKYYGETIGITLPDGTEKIISSRILNSIMGRYLCFQPLNSRISKAGCTMKSRNVIAP